MIKIYIKNEKIAKLMWKGDHKKKPLQSTEQHAVLK